MAGEHQGFGAVTRPGENYTPTYEDHFQNGQNALTAGHTDSAENHFASALKLVHHQFFNRQTVAALRAMGDVYHARVKSAMSSRLPSTERVEGATSTRDPSAASEKVASFRQDEQQECVENDVKQTERAKFQMLTLAEMEQVGLWTVNAVALYNSAIVRSGQDEEICHIQTSIRTLEELFLLGVTGEQKENCGSYRVSDPKSELRRLREECEKKLDDLDAVPNDTENELDRAEAIRTIYKQIAVDVTGLIRYMVEVSIDDLGQPPCKFALIGMGSLAREETTPYSDFEFAILLEEGGDSDENRQYFRNLTRLLHLKVLDLGETILPAVAIKSLNDFYSADPDGDWFYDTGPRGFAFDGAMPGASKTPLGRPEFRGKPALELIRTPSDMASLQTPACAERYGFHVDAVLRTVAYVAGDRKLVEEYESLVQQILCNRKPPGHLQTASETSNNRELCVEESANVDSQATDQCLGRGRAILFLQAILHSYNTTLQEDEDGKLFQVKKEIYRLPSMVVNGLGLLHGLKAKTAWDIIDEMADNGLITKMASQNLKVAVSIATELRLRTYLSNKSQSDDVTPMKRMDTEGTEDTSSRLVRELTDVMPKGALVRFYQTVFPLEDTVSAVLKKIKGGEYDPASDSTAKAAGSLTEDCLLDTSSRIKSLIHLRLSQYTEAISRLEEDIQRASQALDVKSRRHVGVCNYNLGNAYRHQGDLHKAKYHYQQALEMWRQDAQSEGVCEHISHALHALGIVYHELSSFHEALEAYGEALELRKQLYVKDKSASHPLISNTLHGLASVYRDIGDYEQALDLENQALEGVYESYGPHRAHFDTAICLSGLGSIHREMANFKDSRKYFQNALRMLRSVLGENVAHPQIAMMLTALANLDGQSQGLHLQCLSKYFQALQIFHILHGVEAKNHEIAGALDNIGRCLDDLGHFRDAESYHRASLDMFPHIYGRADHMRVAGGYNNLGSTLLHAGKFQEGLKMLEKALEIRQAIFQERENPEIAASIANIGHAHWKLGNLDKARQYTEEAIAMATNLYKANSLHPGIIVPMQTLGVIYMDRKEWISARQLLEKILEMAQTLYGGSHSSVAIALCNLGAVHGEMLEYRAALDYLHRAEKVSVDVFGESTPHPQVAMIWNNLGVFYKNLEDTAKAMDYLTRSLQMREALYGKDSSHPDIGWSFSTMGILMRKLGNIETAATYFERALTTFRGCYGNKTHPLIAGALDNLGIVFYDKGDYFESLKYLRESHEMKKQLYGEKPNVAIALTLNNLANTYSALGENETALDLYRQTLDIYEDVHGRGASHPDIAQSLFGIGNQYISLKRCQDGIELLQKAMKMFDEFYGTDSPRQEIAQCLNNIAFAYYELNDFGSAIVYFQRSLVVVKQLYGDESPKVATALNHLGTAYCSAGDVKLAMMHLENAVRIYQLSPNSPSSYQAFFNIAKICLHQGNKTRALGYFQQGINALQSLPGDASLRPELVTGLNSAAQILSDGKSYKEAAEYWENAIAAYSKMRRALNVDLGKMQFNLAMCYSKLGDVEKERTLHEQALEARIEQHGEASTNIDVGLSLLCTGKVQQKAGNHLRALELLQKAAAVFQVLVKTSFNTVPLLADTYGYMGKVYQTMGDQEKWMKYMCEMTRTSLQCTDQDVGDSIFADLSSETKSLLENFPELRPTLKQAATTVKMLRSWRSPEDLNGARVLIFADLVQPRRDMSKPQLQLFGHFLADIGAAEEFLRCIRNMETSYGDVISNDVTCRCLMLIGELCVGLADSSALMCHRLVTAGMVAVLSHWLENFQEQYPQDQKRSSLVTFAIHTIHNCCKVPDVRSALKDQNIGKMLAPYLKAEDLNTRLAAVLATSYLSEDGAPEADSDVIDFIVQTLEKALQGESRSHDGYSALELVMGIGALCGNAANKSVFQEKTAAALVEQLMEEGDEEETEAAANTICALLTD